MRNPCKDCLVRVMCIGSCCENLNIYIEVLRAKKKLVAKNEIYDWIKQFEVRPQVIETAKKIRGE